MADQLGIGLIGCGHNGQIHASALGSIAASGEAILPVAASDPDPAACRAARRNWGFDKVHADPHDVLSDPDVDVVYICTPTWTHGELYRAALETGKHLYAEKPLAPTFEEVRALCELGAGAPVTAQVGFQLRHHALLRRVKAAAESVELGPAMAYLFVDDEYFPTTRFDASLSDWRSDRSRAGGGTLLEHAIHDVDLAQWLFGPAASASARTRNVLGYDVEDTAALTIEHTSGVVGNILSIFGGVKGRAEARVEVFFRDGVIDLTWGVLVDGDNNTMRIQRAGEAAEIVDPAVLVDEQLRAAGIEQRPFFWTELASRDFLASIRAGEPASPGLDDALAAHATVEAAYRSADTGTGVPVSSVLS